MNFRFSTTSSSFTNRFEHLFAFPKICDVITELCSFTAILDVPSLLLSLSCQTDIKMSFDLFDIFNLTLENGVMFVQIYTIFIKMLELFSEISFLNSILFDFTATLGFTISFTQYFVSHIHQTQCTHKLLSISLTRSPIMNQISDKQTILLSQDFQYLLNFPNSKVQ